jgi:FAD/FMN-containing dehydrogenase/Fe-S oxidoreductase
MKQKNSEFKIEIMLANPKIKKQIQKQYPVHHDGDLHFQTSYAKNVNVISLERELKKIIKGEVRFDNGSKALYSTDASNYRQIPIGVVIPRTREDIINTVALCKKFKSPVLMRGGGTSLAGQCCNVAVVMDLSKYYNKVLLLDKKNKTVKVETGIVLDDMKKATEEKLGLTFGPDPATHNHCTIGGMLGNNSCGVHSVMAAFEGNGARTSDNVEEMTILTYDGLIMKVGATSPEEMERYIKEKGRKGEIFQKLKNFISKYESQIRTKFPNIPRRVSGYNLPELLPENGCNIARALVGSENTLVTILDATMKLLPKPKAKSLLVLGYPDLSAAGYAVPFIMKYKPIGLEGLDELLIGFMQKKGLKTDDISLLPKGKAWLLVEFGGNTKEESDAHAKQLMDDLKKEKNSPNMSLFDDVKQEQKLWEVRESGLGATAWVPGQPMTAPGWEDSAVPPDKIGDYLKDIRNLFHKYGYNPSLYGHFGQGCVHCRVGFDLLSEEGINKYKKFTEEAAKLVVQYGGSISGEHGDGQARGDLLEIMYGKEMIEAFREFKRIWDPEWKMNPGKIIDTYGQTNDLRLGADFNPPEPETYFKYPDDNNSFNYATLRCVGVGECRRENGGTMCPSYMVTREEKHSTRGRARLLFEMMQGDVIRGWKNEAVKDALHLCLSCKGCKGDCPVNVDMATYKAEFLSHYYKGKLRRPSAYAFGWIYWWARMASVMPGIVNFFTQTPGINNLVKAIGGISQKRKIPKFATYTFRDWFFNRKKKTKRQKQKVILWADTFNNFFTPEILVAGVDVLEAAGCEVLVPKKMLCCGRPLYDYGMLHTAKNLLIEIIDTLEDAVQQGIPVVGLEPSCVAVFRDELINLFPENAVAKKLHKQTYTLAEFLSEKVPHFKIPHLQRKALLHGHCQHKAIMKLEKEENLFKDMQLELSTPDSGCCGMAGGFGYEKGDRYHVSIQAGERVLLPAVRSTEKNSIIIADGFSCREQIEQETDRKAMHTAQVLQMALSETDSDKFSADMPEKKFVDGMKLHNPHQKRNTIMQLTAFGAGIAFGILLKQKRILK